MVVAQRKFIIRGGERLYLTIREIITHHFFHARMRVYFALGAKCYVCLSCFGIFNSTSMPDLKLYSVAKSNLEIY